MISSWWASVKVDFGAGRLSMTSTALRTIRTLTFWETKLFNFWPYVLSAELKTIESDNFNGNSNSKATTWRGMRESAKRSVNLVPKGTFLHLGKWGNVSVNDPRLTYYILVKHT